MAIHNDVRLEGRLVADPDLGYSTGEKATARMNFTVAVNRDYKNADGGYDADFIRCIVFGQRAEFISKYFHKGDPIIVSGHIQTGSYTNKDGVKVYTTDVAVENVGFTVGGRSGANTEGQPVQTQRQNQRNTDFMNVPDTDGDELPWDN